MHSWRYRYHWRALYLLVDHSWFRGRYDVRTKGSNTPFHDVEKVFDVLRTFLVIVTLVVFYLVPKPLEVVED